MKIVLHKNFEKRLSQLPQNIKSKFKEKMNVFLKDPYNPALNNHPLKGKNKGFRSINITADVRALYKRSKEDYFIFVEIGNHSNLYK